MNHEASVKKRQVLFLRHKTGKEMPYDWQNPMFPASVDKKVQLECITARLLHFNAKRNSVVLSLSQLIVICS